MKGLGILMKKDIDLFPGLCAGTKWERGFEEQGTWALVGRQLVIRLRIYVHVTRRKLLPRNILGNQMRIICEVLPFLIVRRLCDSTFDAYLS